MCSHSSLIPCMFLIQAEAGLKILGSKSHASTIIYFSDLNMMIRIVWKSALVPSLFSILSS